MSGTSAIRPNTFIIGVQKSATTSVYDWLSQHPDVCGPLSVKDYPAFYKDSDADQQLQKMESEYRNHGYSENTKIVMQGWVQYLFYPDSLRQIKQFDPNAKLIVVLRNPVDRAISAYRFFKKINRETLSLNEALQQESARLSGTYDQVNDLTYTAHGDYAKQLKTLFQIFDRSQVFVAFYEEVSEQPAELIKRLFEFLGVSADFKPEFKVHNVTGRVKHRWIQQLFFKPSKLRKAIIDNLVDPIIPLHTRTRIRLKLKDWNTKGTAGESQDEYSEERKLLNQRFSAEIVALEELLNISLDHWKKA